ncbi:IS66 family insertion sequence element accessory protein TnpB [Hazenella sp. IB182357]|uniref:IS66 family insertion sequence element accessory protein TnpB n=1 Tax=Polycladospora coralii TaxID=2771432 RepID=A0A926RSE3_9BACL|nr:IS66 family insertion sequence element accessory protein TnpB [Polycladospora coralii]MBD1371040.1 IS66 family insertion sequence element accessory protein TnpB [Polycladospora coralii]
MSRLDKRIEWKERVSAFQASGESISRWCAEQGVKDYQLRYLMKKFDTEVLKPSPATQWMAVDVGKGGGEPASTFSIYVGQVRIEVKPGFDPTMLSAILKVLHASC